MSPLELFHESESPGGLLSAMAHSSDRAGLPRSAVVMNSPSLFPNQQRIFLGSDFSFRSDLFDPICVSTGAQVTWITCIRYPILSDIPYY